MEEKYIKKILKDAKKIKDLEDRKEFLISHRICPTCLTQTIVKDGIDTFCNKCGIVFENIDFYMSHGTTQENGDREEIYVPPSNYSTRASPTRSFVASGRMSGKTKEKFKRLSILDFYIKAGSSESVSMFKVLKRILGILSHNQPLLDKHLIEETALMVQKDASKYLGEKKKSNVYTIIILTFLFLGIPINMKKLYETFPNKSMKTYAHFKKNTSRGIEEIMKKIPLQEKINIKEKLIEQILKAYKISYDKKKIKDFYIASQAIIMLSPNNGLENTIKAIIEMRKYKKFHTQFQFGKNKDKILKIMNKVDIRFR